MHLQDLKAAVAGSVTTLSDPGYAARRDALAWNGRKPEAEPLVILRAARVADIQAGVRFAAAHGLRVSARSGGHNFSGIAVQDGLVIDLSDLNDIAVDAAARIAEVGPGAKNAAMAQALTAQGLAFPLGHCGDVAMGGYLLGGGLGWNAGQWGIACHAIDSADVVLADGSLIRASRTENAQVFWAVQGAGPGFFGIVARYRLRLQPLPRAITVATWTWPLDRVADVARWMQAAAAVLPAWAEFSLNMAPTPEPFRAHLPKAATAVLTVFADTPEAAARVIAETGAWAPAGVVATSGPAPVTLADLYAIVDGHYPDGARYGVESVWSRDAVATFEGLARMVAEAPSDLSHALGAVYPAQGALAAGLPDGAFSMVAPVIGLVHGLWHDPAQDAANLAWLRAGADALAPVTLGHYVGEADLAREGRMARCHDGAARARLDVLRLAYDPRGLFSGRVVRDSLAPRAALAAE